MASRQARLLGHEEDLEGRALAEGVHEPEEAWALDKLGAADAVVDIDGVLKDQPAVPGGVLSRMLDLAGHGALVLVDPGLVGGLARVDGGEQGTRVCSGVLTRPIAAPGTHAVAPSGPVLLSVSARSCSKASASAATTTENTADGHTQDGRGEGPRWTGEPKGQVVTRPSERIASVSGLQNSRHG
jgi:hypothetical protein